MKTISIILIIVGIILGLLGLRSYWLDYSYKNASIAVKASVESVEVKPKSGKAVGSIRLVLSFIRDGVADSTAHNFSQEYSNINPLPTAEELQGASLYVRYVPKENRGKTSFPNQVLVSNTNEYEGFYNRALFGQMFTFILLGVIIRLWRRKQFAF